LASSLTSMVCCMCSSNCSAVDMSAFRGMASEVLQGTAVTEHSKLRQWPLYSSLTNKIHYTTGYRRQNYLNSTRGTTKQCSGVASYAYLTSSDSTAHACHTKWWGEGQKNVNRAGDSEHHATEWVQAHSINPDSGLCLSCLVSLTEYLSLR
jgi:hypothetical protein